MSYLIVSSAKARRSPLEDVRDRLSGCRHRRCCYRHRRGATTFCTTVLLYYCTTRYCTTVLLYYCTTVLLYYCTTHTESSWPCLSSRDLDYHFFILRQQRDINTIGIFSVTVVSLLLLYTAPTAVVTLAFVTRSRLFLDITAAP